MDFFSVDDVLDAICQRVDVEKQFILISRTNILERDLLQWQRQKKNSPTAMLKVSFFGEAGIDTGAFRKEFLTGELKEINYFSIRIIYVEEMTNL